ARWARAGDSQGQGDERNETQTTSEPKRGTANYEPAAREGSPLPPPPRTAGPPRPRGSVHRDRRLTRPALARCPQERAADGEGANDRDGVRAALVFDEEHRAVRAEPGDRPTR